MGSFKERTQRDGSQLWYRLLAGRLVCILLGNVINCKNDVIIPASQDLEGYNYSLLIIIALFWLRLNLFEPPILSPLDTLSFLPLYHDDLSHINEGGVLLHR